MQIFYDLFYQIIEYLKLYKILFILEIFNKKKIFFGKKYK